MTELSMATKMKELFNNEQNGCLSAIRIDKGLEIVYSLQEAFSIQAKKDFNKGDIAAYIPKDTCLSIRTTAVSDILEQEELGGILGLGIAVMYEMACGEKSPWFHYFSLLPDHQSNCPLFWSQSDLALVAGTDLGRSIESDREFLVSDYVEHVSPLCEKYPIQFPISQFSMDKWIKTCTFISSRAFQVDEYHGESIVPFADLFNHKTDGEHVHFEGQDVCPFCGLSSGCGCQVDTEEEEWQDMDQDEDDEIPDAVPITDHRMTLSSPNPSIPEEEVLEEDDILEMVFVKACKAGDQVFNTYGKHCSTTLARMYGFVDTVVGGNVYSTLRIDRQHIWDASGREGTYEDWFAKIEKDGEVRDRDPASLRVIFWNKVGAEVCGQFEEAEMGQEEEGGCGDDCDHDHHQEHSIEEHSEETEDGCGAGCTHDHGHEHGEEGGEMDESAFDEEAEDDDDEVFDDFCLESTGKPSFQLYCFLHFLFMPEALFENVSGDLDSCIEFLVTLKSELKDGSWIPAARSTATVSSGKGKKAAVEKEEPEDVVLSRKVIQIIQKAAQIRLEGYPDLPNLAELAKTSERAHIAQVIREEEMTIINTFLQNTAHLQVQE